MASPADAEPLVLKRGDLGVDWHHDYHPNGRWLATADTSSLMLWPLSRTYPVVIRSHKKPVQRVEFGPEGEWLASGGDEGILRLTPLAGDVPSEGRDLARFSMPIRTIAASSNGSHLLVGGEVIGASMVSFEGGRPSPIGELFSAFGVAFSPDGRLAAAVGMRADWTLTFQVWRTDIREEIFSIDFDGSAAGVPVFVDSRRALVDTSTGCN